MTNADPRRPDLPEYLTWEELEQLPEEVASCIELWEGRVVWARRGPGEHQEASNLLWSALRRDAKRAMDNEPDKCWRARTETNVFFGRHGKSDFVTPDFLIHRCLDKAYAHVRADDTLLVGEVLSPSNTAAEMEAKKARYAAAGIPWYWEVTLHPVRSEIAYVQAYGLASGTGALPAGVSPLHKANYLLVGTWSPADSTEITIDHPFPITIPWPELAL
ncbi:Uma2 family endonuclease [Nocardia sp. NPDC059177]|uniref:Uma2 family endonuclease n=1 Tax=Nocardia sp. NPDC059177 TaxID=3346759 RepID=UPI0036A6DF19